MKTDFFTFNTAVNPRLVRGNKTHQCIRMDGLVFGIGAGLRVGLLLQT